MNLCQCISTITCILGLYMFLVTNILQIVFTILTYQLLYFHYVAVGRVLATQPPHPPRWLKLVVTFKFLPTCKYCVLPSCIANFHVESLKLEQMYKLRACLCSLKCVSKSHKLPLPTQNSSSYFYFFYCSIATYITLYFQQINIWAWASHLPLQIVLQIKNIKNTLS